jgi:hypothetical protein
MNRINVMRHRFLFLSLIITSFTNIAWSTNEDISENIQNFSFKDLQVIADNTLKVSVRVLNTQEQPYSWLMTPSDIAIFYSKLKKIQQSEPKLNNLIINNPESGYIGLEFLITNKYGETLKPFSVYNGQLIDFNGQELTKDHDRDFEYTIWGLNYTEKNQSLMWKVLPIINFHDCTKLGNRLIETTPRQCLLTNGEIFLDISEKPTQEALSIKNFDDCLIKGQAIINTFPRRCIAAGGHIYTEPPRIR